MVDYIVELGVLIMRLRKIIVIAVLIVLIGCLGQYLIVSFFNQAIPLPLHQGVTDVTRIELYEYSFSHHVLTPVAVLEDHAFVEFWDDLQQVECKKHVTDPHTTYGELVIRITYHDGSIDTLSTEICTYYHNGTEVYYDRCNLNYDNMLALFLQYTESYQ